MKGKTMKKKVVSTIVAVMAALTMAFCATGCREADKVTYNISKEADNFNVMRRITVFNVRTDKVLWQMTGRFSIKSSDGDLDVICEIGDGKYSKHFFDLNTWTTYIIEDLSGTDVSRYSYELEFMPETIPGVVITDND